MTEDEHRDRSRSSAQVVSGSQMRTAGRPERVVSLARRATTPRASLAQPALRSVLPAERLIVVNARHPEVRRRFSVAHELGHVALGHEQIDLDHAIASIFGDDDEDFAKVDGDLEQEANAFATELLMPRASIKELAQDLPADELGYAIQSSCNVSQQAAWYRMIELKVGAFAPSPRRKR